MEPHTQAEQAEAVYIDGQIAMQHSQIHQHLLQPMQKQMEEQEEQDMHTRQIIPMHMQMVEAEEPETQEEQVEEQEQEAQ